MVIRRGSEEYFYEGCSDPVVEAFEKAMKEELGFDIGTSDSLDQNTGNFISIMNTGENYRENLDFHGLQSSQVLDFYRDAIDREKPEEFLREVYSLEEDEYRDMIGNIGFLHRPESKQVIAEETNNYLDKQDIPVTDVAVGYLQATNEYSSLRDVSNFVEKFLDLENNPEQAVRDNLMQLKYETGLTKTRDRGIRTEFKLAKTPQEDLTYSTVRDGIEAELE